jgi:hypothetical protein
MYCPSCGSEISVELKYCNRCGANLASTGVIYPAPAAAPVKLTLPSIVLGLTVTIGLGIIFSSATEMARIQLHPAAIAWMVIFSLAMLFGCSALLIRFWSKMLTLKRESYQPPPELRPHANMPALQQQLPPRFEPIPSVTEHTTRTFSPAYRDDPAPR